MNWIGHLNHKELKALDETLNTQGWKEFTRIALPKEIDRHHSLLEMGDDNKARGEITKVRAMMALKTDVRKLLTSRKEEV